MDLSFIMSDQGEICLVQRETDKFEIREQFERIECRNVECEHQD